MLPIMIKNPATCYPIKNRESESTTMLDYETSSTVDYDSVDFDSGDSSCSISISSNATNTNEQDKNCLSESVHTDKEFYHNQILPMSQEEVVNEKLTAAFADTRSSSQTPLIPPMVAQSRDDFTSPAAAIETATETNTFTSGKKRVRFGSLTIHEHPVEMGGAGLPRCGPSITLGWKEVCCWEFESVELYEDSRPCLHRKGGEMLQPKAQRVDRLLDAGYSMGHIQRCINENQELRKKRSETVKRVNFAIRTKSTLRKLQVWKKGQLSSNE